MYSNLHIFQILNHPFCGLRVTDCRGFSLSDAFVKNCWTNFRKTYLEKTSKQITDHDENIFLLISKNPTTSQKLEINTDFSFKIVKIFFFA